MGRGTLRGIGAFVCVATLLPCFRGKAWWMRVFDYPRVHVALLGAGVLAAGLKRSNRQKSDRLLLGLVAGAVGVQLVQIAPFTRLGRRQVKCNSDTPKVNGRHRTPPEADLRLLIANVFMHNRDSEPLRRAIREQEPDIILLMETDGWWAEQMTGLEAEYRYAIRHPRDNTYGICLFSKLELETPEIRFLVQDDVPSVRTRVRLRGRKQVWFYGVHPRPPGRWRRDGTIRGSRPRDTELLVLAEELKEIDEPVIVAGDFNDVAWSHTTRRFQRLGKLLDPRVGRGFYNSFHARWPFFRFPLDHLFHSKHFSIGSFGRLGYVGSDHFPICASLRLEPPPKQPEPPVADERDREEAQEELQEAKPEPGTEAAEQLGAATETNEAP